MTERERKAKSARDLRARLRADPDLRTYKARANSLDVDALVAGRVQDIRRFTSQAARDEVTTEIGSQIIQAEIERNRLRDKAGKSP
ncbi:MAG: hypothetical protein AB7G08_26425 [Hyphomicrobiaceae bacterium]